MLGREMKFIRKLSTAILAGAVILAGAGASMAAQPLVDYYQDPAKPALTKGNMKLDVSKAALVVIDAQNDFMSPEGKAWPVLGEAVTERNVISHLDQLFAAAKQAGMVVALSPHHYYKWDHTWKVQGPLEIFQHELGIFDRKDPYSLEGFEGSGADFLPRFKKYIEDGKTIIASPHKLYGPQQNDLSFQLRKQGVTQIVLAGMLANMCVESHLREFLEEGFEVAVIRDAVAAPKLPEGDGNLAALINFRYMANGLWTTDETVKMIAP
ncbi:isochorismatase family cysteine hydrolase [Sinorhizobium mexicanum]|uniref:Cysteine hydrolase n=1 Tax=Sinorhizobium mexicanum TaxID=375549 RepID=A0A859QXT6_9HYPH|nr:isochorismatase family cysteine hydrolase [Sinorhizobium mexicanum]MBP1882471.1 nicotinamidase-related amidase [Sinorhizobium mexicanum]QLL62158.1 cysteine hydrolase [Sinorhizobium mexicanum]